MTPVPIATDLMRSLHYQILSVVSFELNQISSFCSLKRNEQACQTRSLKQRPVLQSFSQVTTRFLEGDQVDLAIRERRAFPGVPWPRSPQPQPRQSQTPPCGPWAPWAPWAGGGAVSGFGHYALVISPLSPGLNSKRSALSEALPALRLLPTLRFSVPPPSELSSCLRSLA